MLSGDRTCSQERECVLTRENIFARETSQREERGDGEYVACKYEVCKILNDSTQRLSDSSGRNHKGELVLSVTKEKSHEREHVLTREEIHG